MGKVNSEQAKRLILESKMMMKMATMMIVLYGCGTWSYILQDIG